MPTATSDGKGRRMHTLWRSRWTLPVFSLFLGAAMLAAMWVGGSLRDGLYSFAVIATAFAGSVVIGVIIVAWLVELARGHSGSPYSALGAVAGLAYLLGLGVLRWRS